MAFTLDPEVAAGLEAVNLVTGVDPLPPVGDVLTRRRRGDDRQTLVHALLPTPSEVCSTDIEVITDDGATLLLRWYTRAGARPGSAVLYVHGGGMIMSSVAIYDGPVSRYVAATGVPFLSVEYRYAPEFPGPMPVSDCVTALRWLHAHCGDLGVDPARIAVMGDSAGGGIAAGMAIVARNLGGLPICRQILIYPMLDDRTVVPDPELVGFLTWTYDDNATGWGALLGSAAGGVDVSPAAAPARLTDFRDLPPAYVDVGELDIFRDEDVAYARALAAAGVGTELHVHPGVPHAWDTLVPTADVSLRAAADRHRVLAGL